MRPRPCPPARRATTTARTALAFAALAVAGAAAAQTSPVDPLAPQADARTRISTTLGAELTRGTYGTAERTDVLALPLSVRIRRGGLRARITATGLRIASDGGLVPALGPDASAAARSAPAAGVAGAGPSSGLSLERSGTPRERDVRSGAGDLVVSASATVYDRGTGPSLDLTGRVKLATASRERGLGTGRADRALQLDASANTEPLNPFASIGWRWAGVGERDVPYGTVGVETRLGARGLVALALDGARSVWRGDADRLEASLTYEHRLSATLKLGTWVLRGFGDASPDWGLGVNLTWYAD